MNKLLLVGLLLLSAAGVVAGPKCEAASKYVKDNTGRLKEYIKKSSNIKAVDAYDNIKTLASYVKTIEAPTQRNYYSQETITKLENICEGSLRVLVKEINTSPK